MINNWVTVALIACFIQYTSQCGSVGNNEDSRIYTNPSLSWSMSPPSAWTYPVTYAQLTGQFFPGQPLTQSDAVTKAQGDISSAVITALSENSVSAQNVKVTSGYTPQEISDCVKLTTTSTGGQTLPTQTVAGATFGIEEQGAITKIAQAGAAITVSDCANRAYGTYTHKDNIVQATAQIEGISVSGFTLRQIAAQVQVALNFNYHVRFHTTITYN